MQPTNYFSDFDDLFERMTQDRWGDVFGRGTQSGYGLGADFAVDVAHQDDDIVVTADVPGFEKADFDISVEGDRLTIRADTDVETNVDEDAYVRRERHHHAMRRTIRLPADANGEESNATYRNGVLTVTVPVDTDDDVRHIDIE